MTETKEKTTKVHCNRCLQRTAHRTIAERTQRETDGDGDGEYDIWWDSKFTVYECCGCGHVTLKHETWFSEADPGDSAVGFYPPPISRPIPRWHSDLPQPMSSLMEEVYAALQANSRRLAIMGARALVDLFMSDKCGDIGGFEQKSEALVEQGLLSKVQKEFLDAALETGHAVTHRGMNPKSKDVEKVIDIVESLLHSYTLAEAASDLTRATPPRVKKAKRSMG